MANQKTLVDLVKLFKNIDPTYRHFHGRLYSFIPPDPEQFRVFIGKLIILPAAFPNGHPASAITGNLGAGIPIQAREILAVQDGQLKLFAQVMSANFPDCEYLAMISPIEKENGRTSYARGLHSIRFLRSLIAQGFGKLPFYTWLADFDLDEEGKISVAGSVVRMPLFGDLYRVLDPSLVNEITDRLTHQLSDYKERLQRACDFFDLAMNQADEAFRFSSYWIALEIIVGGKGDSIGRQLASAYGMKEMTFVNATLRFKELKEIRHQLMHKGTFNILKSYQERLMQLYFWDIVVHQIGLTCRALAKNFAQSGLVEAEERASPH